MVEDQIKRTHTYHATIKLRGEGTQQNGHLPLYNGSIEFKQHLVTMNSTRHIAINHRSIESKPPLGKSNCKEITNLFWNVCITTWHSNRPWHFI